MMQSAVIFSACNIDLHCVDLYEPSSAEVGPCFDLYVRLVESKLTIKVCWHAVCEVGNFYWGGGMFLQFCLNSELK